jgi:hypothetical protein
MDEKQTQALLDWQKLHDWASSKEDGAILGQSCTNTDCPIANYLHEQTGEYWSVGPAIRLADRTLRLDKSIWLDVLISSIDTIAAEGRPSSDLKGPVSKEQFLRALTTVRAGMGVGVESDF